jgi:Flp pilus assembly protein TadB
MNWQIFVLLIGLTLIGTALVMWLRKRQSERDLADQIAQFQGREQAETILSGAQIGEQLVDQLPAASIGTWQDHFAWAQRGGHYGDVGFGYLVFLSLIYGLIGCLAPFYNPAPLAWVVPFIAAAFPFVGLQSKAKQVRRSAERSIPEVATLIAAELASAVPPDQAVERAVEIPGPLSHILRDALNLTTETGRPLFSREGVSGVLLEIFEKANLPSLRAFATQLDLVAQKGVLGGELMGEIASSLAREYREHVEMEVETLDNKITMAVGVFYFAPVIIIILGSFFSAATAAI